MSLITPDFGLIFWMVIIFGAMFFLLAKFGFPVITNMVQKRSDHIEESLRKVDEAQKTLENLAQEHDAMIERTHLEQSKLLKEAAELREQIIAQAKEQAEQEADKIVLAAKEKIAAERESAIREMSSQISMLSMQVAEKILRTKLESSQEQELMIDNMIEELSKKELRS